MNAIRRTLTASAVIGGLVVGMNARAFAADAMAANRTLSTDADTMFRQVDAARTAIRAKSITSAQNDLAKAATADLNATYAASAAKHSMIVPVYGELVENSILDSVAKQPHAAMHGPTHYAVGGNAAQYTFVAVDMKKAGDRISAAQQDLKAGHEPLALAKLNELESNVIIGRVDTDLPLLTAREDFAIARNAAHDGRKAQARAAVKDAAAALDRYASVPGRHASEAHALALELQQIEPTIGNKPKSENQIAAWWGDVATWFKTHA
jgi:hypothetical protein